MIKGSKMTLDQRKRVSEAHKRIYPSEETLRKRSESMKGKNRYKRKEEHKRKISLANKGKLSWMKGKNHAPESILKMSESHKKTYSNSEVRKRLSESEKKAWLNPELRKKQRKAHKGIIAGMVGKHHSEESKRKMSESWNRTFLSNPEIRKRMSEAQRGEKSRLWKGGISYEPYSLDWTRTLKKSIMERDKHTCQICFKKGNRVHHIDYNKKNCNPENLITLCESCHSKTNQNREKWKNFFEDVLRKK